MQIDHSIPVADFPSPPYAELYSHLQKLSLDVIGVEFVSSSSIVGAQCPDWLSASAAQGFLSLREQRAWSQIRHGAITDGNQQLRYVAARAKTYIDLLQIRVYDLSRSYNHALRAWYLNGGERDRLHSNGFLSRIDAAVHAFLADAAAFRDLLAEAVSGLLLSHKPVATRLSALMKRARISDHPVGAYFVGTTCDGGWLKNLSDLRNNIIHDAPVGRSSNFHTFAVRFVSPALRPDIEVPTLWYPLLEPNERLPSESREPDWDNEDDIKSELRAHWEFHSRSLDALHYLWGVNDKLLELSLLVRSSGKFRSEMFTITDDDIIGPDQSE